MSTKRQSTEMLLTVYILQNQGFQETVNNVNGDFEKDLKSNE